jgi:cyclopropane-fatty-acyl-phospholipid synthase
MDTREQGSSAEPSRVRSQAEAVAATNRHYDQNPEIFAAFLDARMKYTCGLYARGNETLDEAQETKLAFIARLLRLRGGEHVLDIGSGWGSMVLYLAQEHGCAVTGVTPAPRQAEFIRDRIRAAGVADLANVTLGSIYDLDLGDRRFDAVTLVGVIEAMPDHHTVLAKVARHLRPGGRLYLSASCYRNARTHAEFDTRCGSRHIAENIFGYGAMRPLSSVVQALEDTGLSLTGVYDLTAHYRLTIDAWRARAQANHARIEAAAPGYLADLLRFFETANAGWGYTMKHYALTAIRSRDGEMEIPN